MPNWTITHSYIALILMTLIVIFCYVMTLPPEAAYIVTMEGGFVEIASAAGYFICVAALIFWGRLKYAKRHYYFLILLCALGFRELDFDKAFTTEGILKSKFLFADYVPVTEKVLGGLVLLLLSICIVHMIRNHFKAFFIHLFRLREIELAVGMGFAFIVVSKTIDGIKRKLQFVDITITEHTADVIEYAEEILELGISFLFLIAISAYFRAQAKVRG